MKPMVKVYLTDDAGEKFFGEGPYRLLLAVKDTGSLRQAALELEMAYTKALKLLNRAEDCFGFALITRSAGGKSGGGSHLTPEGEEVLASYERYRQRCKEANLRIYQEILEQSGKRHLLLTGMRGAGKTTLLNALAPEKLPGLTTRAVPKDSVWMEDNLTGERFPVGRFDPSLSGPENRMRPITENLETKGAALLRNSMESDNPWVSVDEIGYLESGCPAYQQALLELMERKRLLAAVRKQELPFLQSLLNREDVCAVDLDAPFGKLGCVIMASGLGRRFGGNKLMADFLGRPLICSVLDATEGVFAKRVVVTRHQAVADLCREREIPVVLHHLPDRNDTVRLGLEQMAGVDGCLFCPGDQPLLRRETVELMALCADGEQMARLSFGGQPGSPVLFPKKYFPELMALPQGKGGNVLVKKYPQQVRMVPAGDEWELWDADTPEDLEKLKALSF